MAFSFYISYALYLKLEMHIRTHTTYIYALTHTYIIKNNNNEKKKTNLLHIYIVVSKKKILLNVTKPH